MRGIRRSRRSMAHGEHLYPVHRLARGMHRALARVLPGALSEEGAAAVPRVIIATSVKCSPDHECRLREFLWPLTPDEKRERIYDFCRDGELMARLGRQIAEAWDEHCSGEKRSQRTRARRIRRGALRRRREALAAAVLADEQRSDEELRRALLESVPQFFPNLADPPALQVQFGCSDVVVPEQIPHHEDVPREV